MSTTHKETLLEAILEFIGDRDLLDRDGIRAALEREIDRDGPEALLALIAALIGGPRMGPLPARPDRAAHSSPACRTISGR